LSIATNKLDVKYQMLKGLDSDASGLKVKVDGTTVTFDGGGNLKASAGAEAEKIENSLTTATDATLNGDPVYINGANVVGKADAGVDAKSRVIGVIRTGGGIAGSVVEVVSIGRCTGILSGATPNTPYYLQNTGGIGTSLPGANKRVIQVGKAFNTTDLWVDIIDYGKKAA
jgi:predicted extracellular nuclease